MSHEATSWAVKQRGIPPAAKIVLWHLADRHHPDHGCFPSQERLADDCEMSRSSVNNHLNLLEEAGLIRRQKRLNPATKRQESTFYILGFEMRSAQDVDDPCPESAHGAVSKKEADPCPNLSESRVQNLDTNLVRGTSKGTNAREEISQEQLDAIWEAYPDDGKVSTAKANLPFRMAGPIKWLGSLEAVLAAVRAYAAAIRKADQKPKSIVNFLADRALLERYASGAVRKPVSDTDRLRALIFEFKRYGDWKGEGPEPGKPGCKAPPELLAEFGYAERAA